MPNCGRRIKGRKSFGWFRQCIIPGCAKMTDGNLKPCRGCAARLAKEAEFARVLGGDSMTPPVTKAKDQKTYRLTPLQEGLLKLLPNDRQEMVKSAMQYAYDQGYDDAKRELRA